MPRPQSPATRHFWALLATSAAAVSVATALPQASEAAPAHLALAPRSNCPRPYPTHAIRRGMSATGYTTSQGTTPRPFAVRVLGVLKDGISPGVDLIVIRAHSPAIRRAGGVWAGMSGSPIYASDGRLLGALSYSFSGGPSNTAGVTPAAAMYQLFGIGGRRSAATASRIRFDARTRARLVRSGAATPTEAATGMAPISTPFTVSGVPASGFARAQKLAAKLIKVPFSLEAGGSVAPARTAPTSMIRPGAPFAAAISTGAVTFAGIGTTTAVCHGRVLAFGHPMIGGGPTHMTAHTANVLTVQQDPTFSPFVLANVGGRTGVVNQDRLVGLRAHLGHRAPQTTKIVTYARATTGIRRTLRSYTPLIGWVPDVGANAIFGAVLSTLQSEGTGSAHVSYTIAGRRAGGKGFVLHRSDRIADPYSIAFTLGDLEFATLYRLATNPYRHIRIFRVTSHVQATDRLRQWDVKGLQVARNGRWEKAGTVRAPAGTLVHFRARLVQTNQIQPRRFVRFTVQAPSTVGRSRYVRVVGGGQFFYQIFGGNGGGSFNAVLRRLRHAPHDASLIIQSSASGKGQVGRSSRTVRLRRSTIGFASARIRAVAAS